MISPPMVGWWLLADHDEILPLITAISWQTYETLAHNECWRERARPRWAARSLRSGGGSRPALPLARPPGDLLGAQGPRAAVTHLVTRGWLALIQALDKPWILLARSEGFEPPTPRFEVWCSIQLSYERRSPF